MKTILSVHDHNQKIGDFRYIYPVLSRRVGALSIGINLNTNNACNWRCIYCQVPDLQRGTPTRVDLQRLKLELEQMLNAVLHGDFLERHLPIGQREFKSLTFSGNGEPTISSAFPQAVDIVIQAIHAHQLQERITLNLITNGSRMASAAVLAAVQHIASVQGEVWFKVDAVTPAGIRRVNDVALSLKTVHQRLERCAQHCPTWIQTCLFAVDGLAPDEAELVRYLNFLHTVRALLRGVQLYSVARPSYQPEAPRLSALSAEWLQHFAQRIHALGLQVQVCA